MKKMNIKKKLLEWKYKRLQIAFKRNVDLLKIIHKRLDLMIEKGEKISKEIKKISS